jgi:anaerobic glycerol-3-phosphate dehydrogenase
MQSTRVACFCASTALLASGTHGVLGDVPNAPTACATARHHQHRALVQDPPSHPYQCACSLPPLLGQP